MSRTNHLDILRALDPGDPASIQALIDFHRSTFGGFRMVDDGGTGQPAGQGGTGQPATGQGGQPSGQPNGGGQQGQPGDDKLGDAGLRALQSERDARAALKKELDDFKAADAAKTKALAEAFGLNPTDGKSTSEDIVAQLQQQMAALQHANLVSEVARTHKITEADDLALLQGITDAEAMKKLAVRLAPKEPPAGSGSGKPAGRRPPLPDSSQGQGGGNRPVGKDAGLAEAERRFGKKS